MNKMTQIIAALVVGLGFCAPVLAELKYEKKNYYIEIARTKTDVSGSGYSQLDSKTLSAAELKLGYFVMPDFSVELRYDGGDKVNFGAIDSYKLERKASYGLYAKKQAELASGFGGDLSVNGYVLVGLANNNQTLYSSGVELDNKQNNVGVNFGFGLTFEVKKTIYLNIGLTTRGGFDSTPNSLIRSTNHRSLDVGLGVKF